VRDQPCHHPRGDSGQAIANGIPVQASDEVATQRPLSKPAGDRDEQLVSGMVPTTAVDEFEAVQGQHVERGDLFGAPIGAGGGGERSSSRARLGRSVR